MTVCVRACVCVHANMRVCGWGGWGVDCRGMEILGCRGIYDYVRVCVVLCVCVVRVCVCVSFIILICNYSFIIRMHHIYYYASIM